jgi:hypothetical protein
LINAASGPASTSRARAKALADRSAGIGYWGLIDGSHILRKLGERITRLRSSHSEEKVSLILARLYGHRLTSIGCGPHLGKLALKIS